MDTKHVMMTIKTSKGHMTLVKYDSENSFPTTYYSKRNWWESKEYYSDKTHLELFRARQEELHCKRQCKMIKAFVKGNRNGQSAKISKTKDS